MKTILIPTDFSKNSDNAVHFALELNKKLNAKITLFHSYVVPAYASDIPVVMSSDEELKNIAQKGMENLTGKLQKEYPGMNIETMILDGYAEDEIVAATTDKKTDLVIMGTQGASGLREVLIGSTTAAVMEETECPVLAIPEKATFNGMHKIVFATNYAENDFENIENVIDLARKFDAEVILLHISSGELDTAYEYAAIETFKERIRQDSKYENVSFKLLESRDVIDGLSFYLDEIKADMLVMSMHHRTFFQRVFNRSKTKRMAFHTHIPLLAFHVKE
jgi:nucleotide-binding universal stress UspA family protein